MKKRGLLALLLAAALTAGSIAGATVLPQQVNEAAAASKKVKEYGTPWIDSNVAGMVTKSTRHDLKDDFNVGVNYNKYLKTKLRPGYTSEGTLGDVQDIVDGRLEALMTDTSFTEDYAALVQEYYRMFLDWDSRSASSRSFFDAHFAPIKNISDLESLTEYLKSEESFIMGVNLADYWCEPDIDDPSRYVVGIYPTTLSLGDSAEYNEETPYGQRRKKARSEMYTYVLKYAGYTDEEAAAIIADAFAFEKDIAGSIMTNEETKSPDYVSRIHNPRTEDELRASSPVFAITDIIDACGYGSSAVYNLEEPDWLAKLNELYREECVGQIKNYLICQFARTMIDWLDEPAYREYQRIQNEFAGLEKSREDEYYAYSETQDLLWSFVDRMYVSKYCSEKMKNDIRKLLKKSVSEYKKLLKNETWLSAKTRQKAIYKLDHMGLFPVYPDKWEDWSSVTFKSRAEGGSYQQAGYDISKAMRQIDTANVNQSVDKKLWGTSCTDVNASYWPDYNRILIYAGILNGRIYNEKMTEEEIMGSIGTIIGHEISHAFDPTGSQFDEEGRLVDWWTKADKKNFDKRASKLIKFYDSIVPFRNGQHYNGTLVQTEATADMGGVKVMLLSAAKKKNFNYDKFFRSFANTWFEEMTEESIENIYMQDEHPLDYLRINVTVSQFDEFQKTYNIKPGDGMYVAPRDRINIW